MIIIKNCNVDLASLSDQNITYGFAKVMYFDVNAPANRSTRDRTLIRLLKSPGFDDFCFWYLKYKIFIM